MRGNCVVKSTCARGHKCIIKNIFQIHTGPQRVWTVVASGFRCEGPGEVYMSSSPGRGTSLENCKNACRDTPGCVSITHFRSGWCSHHSTQCSSLIGDGRAAVYRLEYPTTSGECILREIIKGGVCRQ